MATKQRSQRLRFAGMLGMSLAGCTNGEGDGANVLPPASGVASIVGATSSATAASTQPTAPQGTASLSVSGGASSGPSNTVNSATVASSAAAGSATASEGVDPSDASGVDTPSSDGGPPPAVTSSAPNPPASASSLNTGSCTPSQMTNRQASGTGPHAVTVETNSDPGIKEGTIFRPSDLGGAEKYPIFVWGEGACSLDGYSNATAMAEIASHGYFVVADGTPNGTDSREMDRSKLAEMGAPLIAYIDWAIAENEKPCSAYYQSLDVVKIASNGFSCGGLMAQGTVRDPRIVTWGVTSSGMAGADQAFYDSIHTPVLFVEGGPSDVAYDGALGGFEAISELGVPVLWFSKDIGHGGDLFQGDGGDFTKLNLAWLNWWLKGDETATGKGLLLGASCPYCSDNDWEVMSAGVP